MDLISSIITIVVVAFMLVVSKMADKKNQTMNNVRRFAEKSTSDLDAYVETKKQLLKDAAVDLDVNKSAVDQLLARVQEVGQGLNSKTSEIEKLYEEVSNYKKSISEIVQMTNQVDENIKMLKMEDSFLNNLSKQIHDSKNKMLDIENKIGKTHKEFEEKNAVHIENLWVSAVEEANKVKQELENQVEDLKGSVSNFEDHIYQLEATRDSMESRIVDEAEAQLKILLNKKVNEFDVVSDQMRDELNEFTEKYQEEVKSYNLETAQLKKDYSLALQKNASILKKYLQSGEEMVKSVNVSTEGLVERAAEVETLVATIKSYDSDIEKLTELSQNIHSNLATLKEGEAFVSNSNRKIAGLQQTYNELQNKLANLESDVVQKNQKALESISEAVKGNIEATSRGFFARFEAVEGDLNEFESRMNDLDAKRENFFASAEREFTEQTQAHFNKSKEQNKELATTFQNFYNKYSIVFKDEKLAAETATTKIETLLSELDDKSNQVVNISSRLSNYDEQMERLVKMNRDASEKLSYIESKQKVINKLDGKVRQSEKAIVDIETRIPQIQSQFQKANEAKLSQIFDDNRKEQDLVVGELRKEIDVAASKVSEFEVYLGMLQARKDEMSENLFEDIKAKADSVYKELTGSFDKIITEKHTLSLKEFQGQTQEILKKFNADVGVLENEAKNITQSTTLSTGRLSATLKEELDRVATQVQTLTDEYRTEVANSVALYQEQKTGSKEMAETNQRLLDQFNRRQSELSSMYQRLESLDSEMQVVVKLGEETQANFLEVQKNSKFIHGLVKSANQGEARLNAIEKRIPQMEKTFSEINKTNLEGVYNELAGKTQESMQLVDQKIQAIQENLVSFNAEMADYSEKNRLEAGVALVQFKSNLENSRVASESWNHQMIQEQKEHINTHLAEFQESTGEIFTKATNLIQILNTAYSDNLGNWEAKAKQFKDETLSVENRFNENINQMISRVKEMDNEVLSSIKREIEVSANEAKAEMLEKVQIVKTELLTITQEISGNTQALNERSTNRLLQIEAQILDFEYALNARYDQLEALPEELDTIEKSVKDYIKAESNKLYGEMNKVSQELTAKSSQYMAAATDLHSSIKTEISSINDSLSSLKEEAHNSVSGRLLAIESDFFSDLDGRKEHMEAQVNDFEFKMMEMLKSSKQEIQRNRDTLKESLTADFLEQVNLNKERCYSELETISNSITEFKTNIEGTLANSTDSLEVAKVSIARDYDALKNASAELMESKLEVYNTQIQEKMDQARDHFLLEINGIKSNISENAAQIDLMLEASQKNIDSWQERQLIEWNALQSSVQTEVSDFKTEMDKNLDTFKLAFKSQQSDFENEYTEKIHLLNNHVGSLGQKVDGFTTHMSEAQSIFSNEIKASKTSLIENTNTVRNEILAVQDGLEKRIASAVNIFEKESSEISREIKEFKTQTKLFERADTLKLKLTEDIQEFRNSLSVLLQQKKELKEVDKDFGNIRKLESELNAKLNNMKVQRTQIDELDSKFTRLLSVSVDVDARLSNLLDSSDKLQALELQARRLGDLEGDLEGKYLRLTNQQKMLEETNSGVALAFKELNKIEDRMKKAGGDFTTFLKGLKESNDRIQLLINGKADADKAVRLLLEFDKKLKALETHLQEVRDSEEWLAGTETRMKAYSDRMDENMRVFTALNSVKNGGGSQSIPQAEKKDMVLNFSKKGWNVEQIQNATGISRGEIELIIQMASKK